MNNDFSRVSMAALVLCAAVKANPLAAQILPKEPINTSPTIYAGTPPTGFQVSSSTPASVSFTWSPTSGVSGYTILRATGTGQPWTTVTSSPLAANVVTFSDQSGIDYRSSYIYRLQANYSGTAPGYVDLPVTLPKPVNPTNLAAKQTNSGAVTITWSGASGATAYTVFGPGIPGGSATATGQSFTVTGLATGQTYTWQVATTYQPGNITTPASEFPSASAGVTPWSGNYRITLLGFTALNPTDDDILDSDGKMDEIMPLALVRRYDPQTGSVIGDPTAARGYIHGDNQGKFRSRIRAGSASNTGGIQKNDVFPAGLTQGVVGSPSTTSFPLKVWEGFLTRDREILLIYPSLWETDDAPSRWFDGYLSNFPPRTRDQMNPSTTTGTRIRQALDAPGISEVRGDNGFTMDSWGPNATGDRPIGIEAVPSPDGQNQGGLFDRIIVLNQRKIEEALAAPPRYPGMPAGTIGMTFTEGGVIRVTGIPDPRSWNFPGAYVLYLRVEALR